MAQRVAGAHWEIALPDGWSHWQEPECYTILPSADSALQISAASHPGTVTRDDLEELAREHLDAGAEPVEVTAGHFVGFTLRYGDGTNQIREWYLANGTTMVFVTHATGRDLGATEEAEIDAVLATLRVGYLAS